MCLRREQGCKHRKKFLKEDHWPNATYYVALVQVKFKPISKLQFLTKILDKAVFTQLISYLNNDIPSGFRAIHSTEPAFVKVANDVLLTADAGDLSVAFNTVHHTSVVTILEFLTLTLYPEKYQYSIPFSIPKLTKH